MFPKKINIGDYDYVINLSTQEEIDEEMKEMGPAGSFRGLCNSLDNEIHVLKELKEQGRARTLLHECIHACLHTAKISRDLEEDLVILLEQKLAGLIRHNPKVVKYLQENL